MPSSLYDVMESMDRYELVGRESKQGHWGFLVAFELPGFMSKLSLW